MLASVTKLFSNNNRNLNGLYVNLPFKVPFELGKSILLRRCSEKSQSTFELSETVRCTIQLKRKTIRPKPIETQFKSPGVYTVAAYPTSEEVNLEELLPAVTAKLGYETKHLLENLDVVHATFVPNPGCEPREIYVFREGVIVLWNVPKTAVLEFCQEMRQFEQHRYAEHVIQSDSELLGYWYNYTNGHYIGVTDKQEIVLSPTDSQSQKYVASHVLAASVKLSVWERQLDKYIRNIEFITEDLKYGRKIKISQERVLRKHGALFALRHVINLSSSLLDPPETPQLSRKTDILYKDLANYYALKKRLRILRDKINHCLELVVLLMNHLRDKHRLRLEWLVIVLILVELAFEAFYCLERVLN